MDLLRTQRARHLISYYKQLLLNLSKTERLKLINEICKILENENNLKIVEQVFINNLFIFNFI